MGGELGDGSGATNARDATSAFVDAMAGMMFLTTPSVSACVTPSMPYARARSLARSYTHCMSSGESASSLRSGNSISQDFIITYATQCSALRGVSAIVHIANVTGGGNRSIVHSKHAVTRGIMTPI